MGMIVVGDWKYVPARAVDEWVMGVDLGKSPTAQRLASFTTRSKEPARTSSTID